MSIDTVIATTTYGRKVHMAMGARPVCGLKAGQVDEVLAVIDEGIEGTIAGLLAAKVAPSRLCGHCFYVKTRATYRATAAA
jgi:hypothetical protein